MTWYEIGAVVSGGSFVLISLGIIFSGTVVEMIDDIRRRDFIQLLPAVIVILFAISLVCVGCIMWNAID